MDSFAGSRLKLVPLGDVVEVNPRAPKLLNAEDLCTFIPMEAVDENSATVTGGSARPYREVARGYTGFQDSDVLIAKITPCMENGKCALVRDLLNGVGFGSTEFHILRAGPDVLPEWLYYFWRYKPTRLGAEANMTGSAGQRRVPSAYIEEVLVPLPPPLEQQRIVRILEEADLLRRRRRYAVELCNSLISAVFRRVFGDVQNNTRRWPVRELGEVAKVRGGLQLSSRRASLPLQRPFLRVANVQRGYLDLTEIKQIGLTPAEFQKTELETDDLLLVEGNGNPADVGRAALWDGSVEDCVHQNHLIRVRCNRAEILPLFLLEQINGRRGASYFRNVGHTTSGLVTISTNVVSEFPAVVPPPMMQKKFTDIVEHHRRLSSSLREASRQANHLFDTLLHRAFSGRL